MKIVIEKSKILNESEAVDMLADEYTFIHDNNQIKVYDKDNLVYVFKEEL